MCKVHVLGIRKLCDSNCKFSSWRKIFTQSLISYLSEMLFISTLSIHISCSSMSLSAIMFCVCRRDIRAPKTTDAGKNTYIL